MKKLKKFYFKKILNIFKTYFWYIYVLKMGEFFYFFIFLLFYSFVFTRRPLRQCPQPESA